MKNFNLILFSVLTFGLFTQSVHANSDTFVADEEAIETRTLNINFNTKTNTGSVEGKICDNCPTITVQITPQSKAYKQEAEVELSALNARAGKPAIVLFDKKTKEVTRIVW